MEGNPTGIATAASSLPAPELLELDEDEDEELEVGFVLKQAAATRMARAQNAAGSARVADLMTGPRLILGRTSQGVNVA